MSWLIDNDASSWRGEGRGCGGELLEHHVSTQLREAGKVGLATALEWPYN